MAGDNLCQICFANELSPENSMIICWNSHVLCKDCCNGIYTSGRTIKCPFDRGEMFDWRIRPPPRPFSIPRSGYLDSQLCQNIEYMIPRIYFYVEPNEDAANFGRFTDIWFQRACSCCGSVGHTIRGCPFNLARYKDHQLWTPLNTSRINKFKGIIKILVGIKYTDYQNGLRYHRDFRYKDIVRELHNVFQNHAFHVRQIKRLVDGQ